MSGVLYNYNLQTSGLVRSRDIVYNKKTYYKLEVYVITNEWSVDRGKEKEEITRENLCLYWL